MGVGVRRGSILHYVVGSHRLRVVVVTADRYNPEHGLVAPLRERPGPDLMPAFLVPLSRQDWPTPAVLDVSRVRSLDAASIAGAAGQLTQATLQALTMALRTYLGAGDR
ncbi:MAG TPA: type II toxin-antitoxin system PemK/MazF family toxin [Micromonosporaceae bacterium]|nr:type II toxin-antitoxin system PemK/MazF family toxin [Micromonosporaceae bacterium]